jgi:hypothetical protein
MKLPARLATVLSLALFLPGPFALAETISQQKNLVCATVDVVACVEGGVCKQGRAQTFDIPTFMMVDVKRKMVHTRGEAEGDASSPIESSEVTEQSIILQGFEEHLGWTLAIGRADGSMTLSATGPEVNFMIMGNCTAL